MKTMRNYQRLSFTAITVVLYSILPTVTICNSCNFSVMRSKKIKILLQSCNLSKSLIQLSQSHDLNRHPRSIRLQATKTEDTSYIQLNKAKQEERVMLWNSHDTIGSREGERGVANADDWIVSQETRKDGEPSAASDVKMTADKF